MKEAKKRILQANLAMTKALEETYKEVIQREVNENENNFFTDSNIQIETKKSFFGKTTYQQKKIEINCGEDFLDIRLNSHGKVIGFHEEGLPFFMRRVK